MACPVLLYVNGLITPVERAPGSQPIQPNSPWRSLEIHVVLDSRFRVISTMLPQTTMSKGPTGSTRGKLTFGSGASLGLRKLLRGLRPQGATCSIS